MADSRDPCAAETDRSLTELHAAYAQQLRDRVVQLGNRCSDLAQHAAEVRAELEASEAALAAVRATLQAVNGLSPVLHLAAVPPEPPPPTNYQKITTYLGGCAESKSIAEIAAAVGIARSCVSAVLYRTHRDGFDRLSEPGRKANRWRVKAATPNQEDSCAVEFLQQTATQ